MIPVTHIVSPANPSTFASLLHTSSPSAAAAIHTMNPHSTHSITTIHAAFPSLRSTSSSPSSSASSFASDLSCAPSIADSTHAVQPAHESALKDSEEEVMRNKRAQIEPKISSRPAIVVSSRAIGRSLVVHTQADRQDESGKHDGAMQYIVRVIGRT
jgi:hypothetical protein